MLLRVRDSADHDSWKLFLDLYAPIVRSYCIQRRIQEADIEDIVQDVMTSVSKAIRSFDYDPKVGSFRSWMGTVAANRIRTFLNQKKNQPMSDKHAFLPDEHCTDPDSDWIAIFSDRILRVGCRKVKEHVAETTWKCFEATWLENRLPNDVAKELKIPVHTVFVNKSRVLKKLEQEIRLLVDDAPFLDGVSDERPRQERSSDAKQ